MKLIIIPIEHTQEGFNKFANDMSSYMNLSDAEFIANQHRFTLIFKHLVEKSISHIIVDVDAKKDKQIIATKNFGDNSWSFTSYFMNESVTNISDFDLKEHIETRENTVVKHKPKSFNIDDILDMIAAHGRESLTQEHKNFLEEWSKNN
jgi:hypothetical protein